MELFSYRPWTDPITTLVDTTQPEDNFKGLSPFLVGLPPAKIGTCPISEMDPTATYPEKDKTNLSWERQLLYPWHQTYVTGRGATECE